MKKFITTYKWVCLPVVLSSAAVLSNSAFAVPSASQQYQDAQQTSRVSHQYVGGNTQIGAGITDNGNLDIGINQVLSRGKDSSTSGGIWADYDVKGDSNGYNKGFQGRGVELNHNWVSRDQSGQASRVNKAKAAYDRNASGHEKVTLGYGQETENLFWDGRVSKGLSGRKDTRGTGSDRISDRAYEYGVGASVGTFLPNANARVRGGLDHEWSSKVGNNEKDARNTTLSAGVEKFFDGTGHSVSLDVSGSKRSGGYGDGGSSDADYSARLGYKYDFAGSSAFQNANSSRRVRVEVPGNAVADRYGAPTQYKKVPTYKTVPIYGKKTVKVAYKRMVKSTMGLEGQTFFKKNSSKLIPSAQQRLTQVAAEIRKTGYKGSIRITGNTCGLGNAQYDQILSEKRARSVRNFLIKKGFNPDHLMARGLGKSHPKYKNIPGVGFKNRRVDIEYLSEVSVAKTAYRTEQKTVQTGTRKISTGFKNVAAGSKNVMIDNGRAGSPRVIWKTETVSNPPAWIQRALNNNIKHDRSINTYQTTEGFVTQVPVVNGPVATDDNVKTSCGVPITIDVLGNDSTSSTSPLNISGFTQGANGAVSQGPNGSLIYNPTGDTACGVDDTFTYTVSDGNGGFDTASVIVTVDEDKVVAEDEVVVAQASSPLIIDVLSNDDPDASINRIVIQPANGTVEIVNGKIVYTADADFSGTDTFTYEVVDANDNKDTAKVTINVDGSANTAPIAVGDQATTTAGQSVTLDSLSNDTDADDDTLTIQSVSDADKGTAVISGGQIVYTPDTGFTGTDTFTYTISDGNGGTATATETITVIAPSNQAPVATNDLSSVVCSGSVTINVLENDDDADTENSALSVLDFTQPSNGTVTRDANGQLVYTSNGNSCGTNDQFTYRVTDGENTSNSATVTVAIAPGANTAPEAQDDKITTQVDQPITLMTVANDTDADGDTLTISDVSQPSSGTVTNNGSTITYTPNPGFVGIDIFDYTITDGNGGSSMATETVTVTAAPNKAPVANDDAATTQEGTPVVIMTVANDTDPDGDTLTIESITQPANGTGTSDGTKIAYTPRTGFTGEDTLTYVISDGRGGTATAVETITVTAKPNTKPVANNDSTTTDVNKAVTLNTVANDTDADGDDLTITNVSNPPKGSVTNNGKTITYTPDLGFVGTDTFQYTITDGNGGNATAIETVIVKALPNEAPVTKADFAATGCATILINVLVNDSDPENQTLSLVRTNGASLGTARVVGNMIEYKPGNSCDKGANGLDKFTYEVSDGVNTVSENITVDVKGAIGDTKTVNDDVTIDKDTTVNINVLLNDSGVGLRITTVDNPIHGSVSFANGVITYTPDPGFVGKDDFFYDIIDQNGYTDAAMVIVNIVEPSSKN